MASNNDTNMAFWSKTHLNNLCFIYKYEKSLFTAMENTKKRLQNDQFIWIYYLSIYPSIGLLNRL